MTVFPIFLLLSSSIISFADATSANNGPAAALSHGDSEHNAIQAHSARQSNELQTPNKIEYGHSHRESANDVQITDAASALAAKYAAANIVTGNIIDNVKASHGSIESSSSGGGGWFGKILGKGSGSDTDQKNSAAKTEKGGIPPPPPPPPMQRQENYHRQSIPVKENSSQQQQQQPPQTYNSYNNYPPYNLPQSYIDPAAYQNLLYELDESTLREMTLTHQLHNISAYVDTLTCESENLIMRIDVLTERLADTTANFNFVHNRNLELEKNCTQLTATVGSLQEEIAGYEAKMVGINEEKTESEKILAELRGELRRVTDELEQLACLVETERFEMEKSEFLKDFKRKQGLKRRKKKGFWAWLFGFESEEKVDDSAEGEQERLRAAQELARSTLLHALQTERASVEELEASLITLQRNNSAIMDVVQSRNSLINELNDRVAVFEEDKMVLKAALRQLQKEIREEAPKLEKAQEGERRLREQLEKLKIDYEEDSEMWQQQYEEGERAWNKTKEELLLIGTYVDQLEDRLATFAIAKKEIELREKQCEELEAQAAKHKKEAESWKSQVEALAKEQGETKPLLEDLVKERAQTRVKMDGLLNEITNLRSEIDGWRQKVEEVEQHSEELKSQTARQLFLRIEESKREWEAEASRRIEEQKQRWDAVKSREFQESLENARTNWQAQSAREFDQRLAHEKADLEDEFQDRQAQLQTALVQEWNAKLSQQKADLEVVFQNEMERRLESERLIMQERKEEEFQQRLSAERASWEASPATGDSSDAALLSDEVERAASKVFDRLDKAGISFEMGEPTLKPVKDLVRVLDGFGDDAVASPMDDTKSAMNETSTASTLNHTTAPQAMNKKPRPSGRNVPFRSVRKAFSRATGMHGLITPSTTQIRQRSKQVQRRPGKKLPATKRLTDDDEQSRNDEPAVLQAATDAESENQLWQEESENTSDMQTEVHNAGEDYYQQDSWGYEGGVDAMALMEPPLPDFDDR